MSFRSRFGLSLFVILTPVLRAQTAVAPAEAAPPPVALDSFVVTASRTALRQSEVPARVTVIDAADLDQSVALLVPDLLKKNSSVDLIQYASAGGLSGVGIRGFRPDFSGTNQHTLILLDGRPAGVTSLSNLSLDNVERVEVLKGPASALYGASAMGGVVNFITRRSTGAWHGSASTRAGSFGTLEARAQAGGSLGGGFDADIAFRHAQADDYSIPDAGEWYRTSYEMDSGAFRLGRAFGDRWRVDFKTDFLFGRDLGSPGAFSDGLKSKSSKDVDHYGADLAVSGRVATHELRATAFASREYVKTRQEPPAAAAYLGSIRNTTFRGAQVQDSWQLAAPLTLTYGVDYQLVKNDPKAYNAAGARTTTSPGDTQETFGYFADAALKFLDGRLGFNAGARFDDITGTVRPNAFSPTNRPGDRAFGTTNPRAGFYYQLSPHWRAHATAGRAFVSPTALQIAGYQQEVSGSQVRVTRGNADLKPESAVSWDAGLGWANAAFSADLTYFQTDVRDKISSLIVTNTTTYRETTYVNAATADQSGVELELAADLGRLARAKANVWRLTLSGTRMLDRVEHLTTGDAVIRNVARLKLVGALSYEQPRWFARVGARYVDGMNDTDNSTGLIFTGGKGGIFEFPSFVVWDVNLGWRPAPRHEVSLQVDNATDRYYYEKADYPMPERAFYARYRFTF